MYIYRKFQCTKCKYNVEKCANMSNFRKYLLSETSLKFRNSISLNLFKIGFFCFFFLFLEIFRSLEGMPKIRKRKKRLNYQISIFKYPPSCSIDRLLWDRSNARFVLPSRCILRLKDRLLRGRFLCLYCFLGTNCSPL